jgi:hypothetical protein
MTLTLDIELPDDLKRLRLPAAVEARLQTRWTAKTPACR